MQCVVQRAKVRVDLRHQIAGQETEALAGLDRRSRQDDPLDVAGLQRPNRHCNGQPTLACPGRADTERDDIALDRLDIRLLPGRLRTDQSALVGSQDVVGEDVRWALVGPHHVDRSIEGSFIDPLAPLGQHDEFLEQCRSHRRPRTRKQNFVTTNGDIRIRQRVLDAPKVPVVLTEQNTHEVITGDPDGDRGFAHLRTEAYSATTGHRQRDLGSVSP